MSLAEMADEVRRRAAHVEHVWDERAIDWPLTMSSVVVEVGGYTGRWALQIAQRYAPRLFVFEPQPWAVDVCRAVLGDAAHVYNVALGDRDGTFPMGRWETDGCSLVNVVDNQQTGQMREIKGMLGPLQCQIADRIDLMLINIEGYEYTLLPHMLDVSILPKRLLMQWHLFGDPDGAIMAQHWTRLETLGYRIVWTYGVMLTAWERD